MLYGVITQMVFCGGGLIRQINQTRPKTTKVHPATHSVFDTERAAGRHESELDQDDEQVPNEEERKID